MYPAYCYYRSFPHKDICATVFLFKPCYLLPVTRLFIPTLTIMLSLTAVFHQVIIPHC